ncbi:MAG: FAD-dependent oxidoreductase [Ignavibacteriae bacterium]|nr:FAD-dependent oxidoreductase [Ignavibacteriota bacterium]
MSLFDKIIEWKLNNYKIQINKVDTKLEKNISREIKVAIIGSGIAGLTSAILLNERGFKVKLFEKDNFLGGKIGSWKVKFDDNFETNVEHGFHAFFRQYYNLREILKKIDSFKHLIPIDDYLIKTKKYGEFSFKNIETTPILNILSMRKSGIYSFKDIFKNPKFAELISLLTYDKDKTFKKFDHISFHEYADKIKLPNEMRLMFTTFSRAFFAEPQYISMAELIKSFHFYFLSNNHGLIYDVLNDDFQNTLLFPAERFIKKNHGEIVLNTEVNSIHKYLENFSINNESFDYVVMATDIRGTQNIFGNSKFIKNEEPNFYQQIMNQKKSQRYAVLRIWMNKRIGENLPFFIFTDALEILDSVTIYHNMEKESADWANKNNGGIYELHSYALPVHFDKEKVREQLLKEFFEYFPELKSAKILYESLQVKNDFTAFHTNLYNNRPAPKTPINNLYLTGDWIKLPIPAMLMEASASSAIYAVNKILTKENLQEEPILSVPLKGIFAQ